MKHAFFASALFASALGLAAMGAYAGDRDDDIADLTDKKVNVWPKLYAERDADGLDRFLADGFKILEPDGTVRTKADEIAWLRQTPPDNKKSDFLFTVDEIVFADDGIAIVYGHGDSTRRTEDGRPCHHNYWSSNTFIRVDGDWKPVFSHVSGVMCAPIE